MATPSQRCRQGLPMGDVGRQVRRWQSAALFLVVLWATDVAVAAGPPPGAASPVGRVVADAPAHPALAKSLAPPVAPEDIRRGILERELQALQAQARRQDVALAELRARLNRVESEHIPVAVVYGLMLLVLMCLVATGWLWARLRRLRQDAGWWSPSVLASDSVLSASPRSSGSGPV